MLVCVAGKFHEMTDSLMKKLKNIAYIIFGLVKPKWSETYGFFNVAAH